MLTKRTEVLHQQTIMLSIAAADPTVVPSLITTPAKQATWKLPENQMAKLLALSDLEWYQQEKISTIWAEFLAEPNKTAKLSFLQTKLSLTQHMM